MPKIRVDNSPRPRRDPRNERTRPTDLNASFGSSQSGSRTDSPTGMVSFDGLERPFSAGPVETFKDVPDALEDVPDALDDISPTTFDGIPTDVFDAIPSAVTAREEKKIQRLQKEFEGQLRPSVHFISIFVNRSCVKSPKIGLKSCMGYGN